MLTKSVYKLENQLINKHIREIFLTTQMNKQHINNNCISGYHVVDGLVVKVSASHAVGCRVVPWLGNAETIIKIIQTVSLLGMQALG